MSTAVTSGECDRRRDLAGAGVEASSVSPDAERGTHQFSRLQG
jgi:hypothetical protein